MRVGEGGGGAGTNGVGVIPFCAPENRGLHKIVQPEGPCIFVPSNFLSTKMKQYYQQPSCKCFK